MKNVIKNLRLLRKQRSTVENNFETPYVQIKKLAGKTILKKKFKKKNITETFVGQII